jgi:peptidoglycan biosynthesis protein MviN/MurJ (putative lipid II flippase)
MINSLILSIGILIGRLSGYIREIIIASKYGATEQSDNILLMLTIPDLLNNLLASGAIVGILKPLLTSHNRNIEETLAEFTKKLFYISIVFYVFTTVILFFIYDFYLFGLLTISLLSVFPNIYTFIISGYLQFEKRFKKQSLNTLIFNIVIIIFLLTQVTNTTFAFGVIIASSVRTLWIYSDLKNTNISTKLFLTKNTNTYLSYKTLVFMILANGIMFINPMIDKIFAAFLTDGSVAILSYAEKIYLLPVSVFLTTYAVAMFPDLAKLVANNNQNEISKILKKSISLNIFISLVVGLLLYAFSYEIVNLFFSIAKLNNSITNNISLVLNGYIIALIIAGTNSILLNLIFAYKWYNSLIKYSIVIVGCKIVLNILVINLSLNIQYIALGTSLVGVFSIIYLGLLYGIRSRKV